MTSRVAYFLYLLFAACVSANGGRVAGEAAALGPVRVAAAAEEKRIRAAGSTTSTIARLENGFVAASVVVDAASGNVGLQLAADFSGGGAYSEVLARPWGLASRYLDDSSDETAIEMHSDYYKRCANAKASPPRVEWVEKSDDVATVRVVGVTDCPAAPLVAENWTVTVRRGRRDVEVLAEGALLRGVGAEDGLQAVYHRALLRSSSVYGLFDERGVAQMMNSPGRCLGSEHAMSRMYALGGGSAIDILLSPSGGSADGAGAAAARPVVLMSSGEGFGSGLLDLLLGAYPDVSSAFRPWGRCWTDTPRNSSSHQGAGSPSSRRAPTTAAAGTSWRAGYVFVPNDFDFPALPVKDVAQQPRLSFEDLRTYLTGAYGSPAGCLLGYYDDLWGTSAPTVSHPDIGYSPNTNFFDPDNFLALSALLYTGDAYFIRETRRVLERTAETMCGIGTDQDASYCDAPRVGRRLSNRASEFRFGADAVRSRGHAARHLLALNSRGREGQLMHHFIDLEPTYESIATSEQLGPNIFWTWAALRYIGLTQDLVWADRMFPYLDLSVKFLLTFFDEQMDMVRAPGPLWIDVLVRENYTSDSNAVLIAFLDVAAELYDVVCPRREGETEASCGGFAEHLRSLRVRIARAMGATLWDAKSDDHFITQLDPSGETRDFVDYDSNLLAVGFGAVALAAGEDPAAGAERAQKILRRVDSGNYTHVRATWCSEVPYTGDRCDCYIVGGSVCGDSVVTLARIGWVDAYARREVGDLSTFDDLLLKPLQTDLARDVWLYERYDGEGTQIRTSFYFEYPSLVTMLLWEIRYGMHVGIASVAVRPFRSASDGGFALAWGEARVEYSQDAVSIRLPRFAEANSTSADVEAVPSKSVSVHGMQPGRAYALTAAMVEVPSAPAPTAHKSHLRQEVASSTTAAASSCAVSSASSSSVLASPEGVLRFDAVFGSARCVITATLM